MCSDKVHHMGYCGMSFALCMWYLLIAAHIPVCIFCVLFFLLLTM